MDPPPPYSPSPETYTNTSQLPPVSRWHPKMSPYRISVVVATIMLGTLKAFFAYRGITTVSTTLEWIVGVVLTLLIFALDEWESKESYPKCLHPFFTFDCAELMWRTLAIFSISRPQYRSDESKERLRNSTFVPMTGYRILVSTTVVAIGSVKAILAFLGQNTTANYLDWTLAVLITSLLYYIGLYESNSVDLAPDFFVRDHYNIFFRILRDILAMLVLSVCLWGLVEGFKGSLSGFKDSIWEFMGTVSAKSESFMLVQSLGLFMLCIWTAIVVITFTGVVGTVALIGWALQQESEFFRLIFRRGKFAKYYDLFADRALNIIALLVPVARRAWRLASFGLRICVYVFAVMALSTLFLVIVFLMKLFGEDFKFQGPGLAGKLIGIISVQFFFGGYAMVVLWGIYYIIRSLISSLLVPARPSILRLPNVSV